MISNEPEKKPTAPEFRLDVKLRDVLVNSPGRTSTTGLVGEEEGLPEPIYPQYTYPRWPTVRKQDNYKAWKMWKGLGAPYFKHRLMPKEVEPLICISVQRMEMQPRLSLLLVL